MEEETTNRNYIGKTTLGHQNFPRKLKKCDSFIAVSKDHYKLGINKNGSWAVISPKGKIIRRRKSHLDQWGSVLDLIYIQKHQTFFLYDFKGKNIWKISLNDLEPQQWMADKLKTTRFQKGRYLREALNGRAIVSWALRSKIFVFGIKENGSEGRTVISNITKMFFEQIEVGGKDGNILLILVKGVIELVLCKIEEDLSVKVVRRFSLSSIMSKRNCTDTMAISPCAKYVFLHSFNSDGYVSKQLMISVSDIKTELLAILDLASEKLKLFYVSVAYLKTIGDELIFKGITWSGTPSTVVTMVYNKRTREFKELKTQRKIVKDEYFYKLARQGDTLYSIGCDTSKLLEMS